MLSNPDQRVSLKKLSNLKIGKHRSEERKFQKLKPTSDMNHEIKNWFMTRSLFHDLLQSLYNLVFDFRPSSFSSPIYIYIYIQQISSVLVAAHLSGSASCQRRVEDGGLPFRCTGSTQTVRTFKMKYTPYMGVSKNRGT